MQDGATRESLMLMLDIFDEKCEKYPPKQRQALGRKDPLLSS